MHLIVSLITLLLPCCLTLVALPSGSGSGQQSHLMELARKQRMNTDVRKSVFCVIMSSEVMSHNHVAVIPEDIATNVITVGLH